jgi:hypothetical protein
LCYYLCPIKQSKKHFFISTDNKYNGWANYATWRVNLELIDSDYYGESVNDYDDNSDFADYIKESIEMQVYDYPDGFVRDYCEAFLSDVNWYEIAQHIWDEHRIEEEEEEENLTDEEIREINADEFKAKCRILFGAIIDEKPILANIYLTDDINTVQKLEDAKSYAGEHLFRIGSYAFSAENFAKVVAFIDDQIKSLTNER